MLIDHLANLSWAFNSEPLLSNLLAPEQVLAEEIRWPPLTKLDRMLSDDVCQQLDEQTRLGKYFEQIMWLGLAQHPRWERVQQHVVIQGEHRTLGELDLIVRNSASKEVEHWELAVKFYLGFGDVSQAKSWHGPRLSDRLDKKIDKLVNQQLPMAALANAQGLLPDECYHIARSRLLVKGRLFYPLTSVEGQLRQSLEWVEVPSFLNPKHEYGWWASADDWQKYLCTHTLDVQPLRRLEWLVPSLSQAPIVKLQDYLARYDRAAAEPETLWCPSLSRMIFVVSAQWLANVIHC